MPYLNDRPPGAFLDLVNTASKHALLEDIAQRLENKHGFTIATLNLDHIVKLGRDDKFLQAYKKHTHVVADGNPIVWLRRIMGQPVELVPGSDLLLPLLELAQRTDTPVAFLGSTENTLERAKAELNKRLPGLRVVTCISPSFGFDVESKEADDAFQNLSESGAQLCFLALGAPKQERLAARGTERAAQCGFVSIGAGLDFIAGHQRRAPAWIRRLAMEWLWRMMSNPTRLFRRYVECAMLLPTLTLQALKARSTR